MLHKNSHASEEATRTGAAHMASASETKSTELVVSDARRNALVAAL